MRLAALSLVLAAACSVELPPPVPGQPCSTGGCPAPLVCDPARKRCVDPLSSDRTGPRLQGDPDVTPTDRLLADGERLDVRLRFDEPLDGAPAVFLRLPGGGSIPFEVVEEDAAWHASFTAQPGVPEGIALPVVARARDREGNESDVDLGTARVDLVIPDAAAGSASYFAPQDEITVEFETTEPVDARVIVRSQVDDDSGVRVELGAAFGAPERGPGRMMLIAGAASVPQGFFDVAALLVDRAGNSVERVFATVEVDREAPNMSLANFWTADGYLGDDAVVRPGAFLGVTLSADKPMLVCPRLTLDRDGDEDPFQALDECRNQDTFPYFGSAPAADGVYELVARGGRDPAWNTSPDATLARLRVDGTPPVLTEAPVSSADSLHAGDTLTVTAGFDEPVVGGTASLVFDSGASIPVSFAEGPSNVATLHASVDASTPRGTARLVFTVRDEPGNVSAPIVAGPYTLLP